MSIQDSLTLPGSHANFMQGYLDALSLVERLHRLLLDVIKDEFERVGVIEINAVQALLLFNIGDNEVTAGELKTRGYYQGSNQVAGKLLGLIGGQPGWQQSLHRVSFFGLSFKEFRVSSRHLSYRLFTLSFYHFIQSHACQHGDRENDSLDLAGPQRHQGRTWAKTRQSPANTKTETAQHQGFINIAARRQPHGFTQQ